MPATPSYQTPLRPELGPNGLTKHKVVLIIPTVDKVSSRVDINGKKTRNITFNEITKGKTRRAVGE